MYKKDLGIYVGKQRNVYVIHLIDKRSKKNDVRMVPFLDFLIYFKFWDRNGNIWVWEFSPKTKETKTQITCPSNTIHACLF